MVVSSRDRVGLVGSRLHAIRRDTHEGGAVAERELVRQAPVSSCQSPVGLLASTPREASVSAHDRHLAAVVARTFGSAEEAAARGDYADALSWVQVVQAIGDLIPIEYQTKRRGWLSTSPGTGRETRRSDDRLEIRGETSRGSRSQPQARRGSTAITRFRPPTAAARLTTERAFAGPAS
jgi:hypothetical protein